MLFLLPPPTTAQPRPPPPPCLRKEVFEERKHGKIDEALLPLRLGKRGGGEKGISKRGTQGPSSFYPRFLQAGAANCIGKDSSSEKQRTRRRRKTPFSHISFFL